MDQPSMDQSLSDQYEESMTETPEDVAVLYSWANLHGAKYRDFSASRREYRAQVRHRAAEELREQELQGKAEAEAAAADAERIARDAERAAQSPDAFDGSTDRERAIRDAEEAARRAAAERVEAARRAEAAAIAEAVARREEREIAEAHASAERQAARYVESESRRRMAAGPQPRPAGLQSDPYEFAQGSSVDLSLYTPDESIEYTQGRRPPRDEYGSRVSGERRAFRPVEPEYRRRPQGFRPDEASGVRAAYQVPAERGRLNSSDDGYPRIISERGDRDLPQPANQARDQRDDRDYDRGRSAYEGSGSVRRAETSTPDGDQSTPAWLYGSEASVRAAQSGGRPSPVSQPPYGSARDAAQDYGGRSNSQQQYRDNQQQYGGSSPQYSAPQSNARSSQEPSVADTLQHSRERVASRWYAMRGVFGPGQETPEAQPVRRQETRTPVLAIFSLAGGVGKTSMVATLGRALSSLGEKVLLADTTSQGLLPYYFGASELRPGVTRTFSPPTGSTDAPIHLVSYDVVQPRSDTSDQNGFAAELAQSASGTNRVLLDLNSTSGWIIRRLPGMAPTVLVPVAPDMNSVISLQAVERYFQGATDSDGKMVQPHYVLNQFDASLPLHLDVREVLRRQLGDRLLSTVIRRAPAVSEALAEGMTVVDYAPDSGVAEDFMKIADWLRSVSAPTSQGFRNVRWSER